MPVLDDLITKGDILHKLLASYPQHLLLKVLNEPDTCYEQLKAVLDTSPTKNPESNAALQKHGTFSQPPAVPDPASGDQVTTNSRQRK